jgi:hypothetical protein
MEEEEEDNREQDIMWGTVTAINEVGYPRVKLDDGGETIIPKFWYKLSRQDPADLKVGTRLRCVVTIEWKPTYFVEAILNVVHEGGKKEKKKK